MKNIQLKLLVVAAIAVGTVSAFAQGLYVPRSVARAYTNATRSMDGRPGKNYWQNKASYDIHITVAPPTRTVTGTEEITYTNNSPDTLDRIVFRLQLNSHSPEAPRENIVSSDYLTNGVTIDEFMEDGVAKPWREQKGATWQAIKLNKKLAPKGSVKFSFKWHYDVSVESGREGAIDKTTFFLAYFYPRVAVYDDIDGWDTTFFTEGHEFYNDFNDYNVQITAPKDFIVWATGDLQNADTVIKPEFAARLKRSFTSDDVIHVATAEELAKKSVTVQSDTLTWKWRAENVTDFAAAVSDHFIWDAGSVIVDKKTNRRASVQAAYNIEAKDFQQMVDFGKHTLDWTSNNFPGTPYPFQKTTIVRGFADMEYPMMVNDSSQEDPNFTRFVVEHEILHSWFPFYMGINEQRYGFMDEGWTTAFENLIAINDVGKPTADNLFKAFRVQHWIKGLSAAGDLPIITPGDSMTGSGLGINEYGKAALGYLALKDLLGDTEFKHSLHEFIHRWNGKHPLPWDMFNSFSSASGQDLNWFFNNWFFSNGFIDLAVPKVEQTDVGTSVSIQNIGGFDAPVDLVITYTDGTTNTLHQTPAIWKNSQKETKVTIPGKKTVKSVVLDGGIFMDANEADNKWESK